MMEQYGELRIRWSEVSFYAYSGLGLFRRANMSCWALNASSFFQSLQIFLLFLGENSFHVVHESVNSHSIIIEDVHYHTLKELIVRDIYFTEVFYPPRRTNFVASKFWKSSGRRPFPICGVSLAWVNHCRLLEKSFLAFVFWRLMFTSLIAFFRGAKKSSKANLYECLCWWLCIVMLILFCGGEFTV